MNTLTEKWKVKELKVADIRQYRDIVYFIVSIEPNYVEACYLCNKKVLFTLFDVNLLKFCSKYLGNSLDYIEYLCENQTEVDKQFVKDFILRTILRKAIK